MTDAEFTLYGPQGKAIWNCLECYPRLCRCERSNEVAVALETKGRKVRR